MLRLLASLALAGLAASPGPRLRIVHAGDLARALRPDGRPLVVHLWASWCRPCVAEMPLLTRALYGRAGNDIAVLFVSLDEPDRIADAERVLSGLPHREGTLLLSPFGEAEPVLRKWDPAFDGALPTTVLVDDDGRVVVAQRGHTRLDALERAMDGLRPRSSR